MDILALLTSLASSIAGFMERHIWWRKTALADCYGCAYTEVSTLDAIRIYVRGTLVNRSNNPISVSSINLQPSAATRIPAKEAPFLIFGYNDVRLMATEFPVTLPPFSSCKIDTIFHCQPRHQSLLRLPSVDILTTQEVQAAIENPRTIGYDATDEVWEARFSLETSRGPVHLQACVDWRDYRYIYAKLAAIHRNKKT